MIKQILKGHTSPETAFVVNDYPYGFTLRCKIRYWLETNKNGTRFVSQTTNPKAAGFGGDVWNKPKASTYCRFAGCMYLNEDDHVCWSGLTAYTDAKEAEDWFNQFKDGLCDYDLARAQEWIKIRKAYEGVRRAAPKQ